MESNKSAIGFKSNDNMPEDVMNALKAKRREEMRMMGGARSGGVGRSGNEGRGGLKSRYVDTFNQEKI